MHASTQFRLKACTTLSLLISSLAIPVYVQAQSTDTIVESVLVTGSRIARDGYSQPTPVSVLSEEEIDMEAPESIADFVNTLPSVQGSTTASSTAGSLSSGLAGIAALNLRGLGTGRTLVLFDGQRSVASSSNNRVDTNTFPQALVERVEVVTGGASSAYGSDAVGGVINFILDRDYTGVKASAQIGGTTEGEDDSSKFVLTAGTPIADGKGHLLFSAETVSSEGIFDTVRDWNTLGYQGILNPERDTAGEPYYIVGEGIGYSAYTPGGLITSGDLRGTYFGEGGSVEQLEYGTVSGNWMIGGDWDYATSGIRGSHSLASADERDSLFGRASYEITPSTEVYAQLSYASYEGESYYISPTSRGYTMYADNAFLPTSVSDALAAAGETEFTIGTSNEDFPISGTNNYRETQRLVLGIEGDFDAFDLGFGWDAYYQRGVTNTDEHQLPTFNNAALALASDAVLDPTTNEIVCRSTLTDPANGCVPLNRFGVNVASDEALDYVLGRPQREQEFIQEVMAVNFTTSDIQGWASPIDLAFGFETRTESIDGEVDPIYNSGWKYGNYKVTSGEYDVSEAYIETVFSIVEDLEFNGAFRATDYSTSGSVTTWKAGLTYALGDDVVIRATQSKDIRAANLAELYDAGTARSNSVTINGDSLSFVQNLQGTPTVAPEEASSFGLGVVYQPSYLPGFSAAVDYYDIEVDGVIAAIGAQDVADLCYFDNVQRFCDNINFDSGGVLQTIDLTYENLNSLTTKGLDLEAGYSVPLGDGNLRLRALATHVMEYIQDNGTNAIDEAGENTGSTPDWSYRLNATYNLDTWTFGLTGRGVSDGTIQNEYIECSAGSCPESVSPAFTINDNSVPGEIYWDTYIAKSFTFGDTDSEVFLSVKNVLDTDPVLVAFPRNQGSENRPGYLPTNRNLYDVLGRTFSVGARFEF